MTMGGESEIAGPSRFDPYQYGVVYCAKRDEYIKAEDCPDFKRAAEGRGWAELRLDRCKGC